MVATLGAAMSARLDDAKSLRQTLPCAHSLLSVESGVPRVWHDLHPDSSWINCVVRCQAVATVKCRPCRSRPEKCCWAVGRFPVHHGSEDVNEPVEPEARKIFLMFGVQPAAEVWHSSSGSWSAKNNGSGVNGKGCHSHRPVCRVMSDSGTR